MTSMTCAEVRALDIVVILTHQRAALGHTPHYAGVARMLPHDATSVSPHLAHTQEPYGQEPSEKLKPFYLSVGFASNDPSLNPLCRTRVDGKKGQMSQSYWDAYRDSTPMTMGWPLGRLESE